MRYTARNDDYSLIVQRIHPNYIDEYNPRSKNSFGKIILFGDVSNLGDYHSYSCPTDFFEDMLYRSKRGRNIDADTFYKKAQKDFILLPLQVIKSEDSLRGISFIGADKSYPPALASGWIYVSQHQVRSYYGCRITNKLKKSVESRLAKEVTQLDDFLNGRVYAMYVYTNYDAYRPLISSAEGFLGTDFMFNGLLDQVPPRCVPLISQLKQTDNTISQDKETVL